MRIAGWIPRARSRSSLRASPASSPALRISSAASGSPFFSARLGHPQGQRERDEPLLGAVVKVALDAPRPASAVVMIRERAPELRDLSGQLGVGVRAEQHLGEEGVEAAQLPERRDAHEGDHQPERHEQERSPSVSTWCGSRPWIPSGVDQYQAGAAIHETASSSTTATAVNDTMPSGSWSSRKTQSFQVAGSPRRVLIRRDQPASRGSGLYGSSISTPVSAPIRRRVGGPRASATRTGSDEDRDADQRDRCTEVDRGSLVTRNVNHAIPSGSAITR